MQREFLRAFRRVINVKQNQEALAKTIIATLPPMREGDWREAGYTMVFVNIVGRSGLTTGKAGCLGLLA
jgi:hypothetical protein